MLIFVGNVILHVFDTCGTMDMCPEVHDRDTTDIKFLKEARYYNQFCIKMYERVDESSLARLAMLYQLYGLRICMESCCHCADNG